jgi:rubrerythrin
MKPITRARFGESMDVNPTSLMRNNKKAINSYKELMKKVDDANIKKTVETPEE